MTSPSNVNSSAFCNSPDFSMTGNADTIAVGYEKKMGSTPRPYHSQIPRVSASEKIRTAFG